jgi:hypothetical protein
VERPACPGCSSKDHASRRPPPRDANEWQKSERLALGFLSYTVDTPGSRLVMLVDPDLIGVREFRRWVTGVAREANRAVKVRGEPVTVTVQEACFPAAQVETMRQYFLKHREHHQGFGNSAGLDGRFHIDLEDRAYGERLQKRFGPVLAVGYDVKRISSGPGTTNAFDLPR